MSNNERVVLSSGCEVIVDPRLNGGGNVQLRELGEDPDVNRDLIKSLLNYIENSSHEIDSLIIITRYSNGDRAVSNTGANVSDYAYAASACQHTFSRVISGFEE
jgi:hypothetical protein